MVILLSVLYTLVLVTSFAVCFLKGKPAEGVVGFAAWVLPMLITLLHLSDPLDPFWGILFVLTSPIWMTFAVLTFVWAVQWARPDSQWAKVFYAKDDMAIARRQFPDAPVPAPKGRHDQPA